MIIIMLLILSGCTGQPSPVSASASETISSPENSELSQETLSHLSAVLEWTMWESSLTTDWTGSPEPETIADGRVDAFEILEAKQDGNTWQVTAELYGPVFLDLNTFTDAPEETKQTVSIQADGPHAPSLAFGVTQLEFQQDGDRLIPISCKFEGYDQPGTRYLKEKTKELEAELASSPRIEIDQYDPFLVDYVYRLILAHRYIESAEDITLWDMENFVTEVVLSYNTLSKDGPLPEGYVPDPEIFRLATGLQSFHSYLYLTDYSVFENMTQLKDLFLYCGLSVDYIPDFSTLKIGHTESLAIKQFPANFFLDLTNSQVERLELHSDVAGITGFAGCENIHALSIEGTTTDMTLIDAEAFPSLTSLNFNIFSSSPRFRDFCRLATFGEDVSIRLSLQYQACNDDTLATLEGVHLDSLSLDPYNGMFPLGDPDPEILSKIDAESIIVEPVR
ncbi:MAG: hypothetical protein KH009_02530 [Clostridiales bacterium]|nr:hypothetical protein [Clostridiales bacterium]